MWHQHHFSLWHERRVPDLREVDGEDGVRAAADVVHAGAGGGAVDVSSLHQLLHVAVVLHQVFGQIWDQGGRSEEVDSRTQHWQEVWWLVTRTFYVRSVFRVLPDSQVVGLSGFPPQQVSHSLVVDLQVAEGKKIRGQHVYNPVCTSSLSVCGAAWSPVSPDFCTKRGFVPSGRVGDSAEQTLTEPRDQTCISLKQQQQVQTRTAACQIFTQRLSRLIHDANIVICIFYFVFRLQ